MYMKPEETGLVRSSCFVCGSPNSAQYVLNTAHQDGAPYFPFLQNHESPLGSEPPTEDGKVKSCSLCFAFLLQQWESHERANTPHIKRLYWLKRVDNFSFTGAELHTQGEYASQMLGLVNDSKQYSTDKPDLDTPSIDGSQAAATSASQKNSGELVLDLSNTRENVPSRCSVASAKSVGSYHSVTNSEGGQDILDLSMPDKDASTEVCYICGDEFGKGTLINIYAKPISNCPFFPSLMLHPRPSRSRPMDSAGRVLACEACHRHLLQQWQSYQSKNVPHSERNYSLRRRLVTEVDSTRFICYVCALEYPHSSLRFLYCRPNSDGEPFYPILETMKPASGAAPMSSKGTVEVCSNCCKSVPKRQQLFTDKQLARLNYPDAHSESTRPSGRLRSPVPSDITASSIKSIDDQRMEIPDRVKNLQTVDLTHNAVFELACYICHQLHHKDFMKLVHTIPDSQKSQKMFFPFLKCLPRPPSNSHIDSEGRILICVQCCCSLTYQWEKFERNHVPLSQRNYKLQGISSDLLSGNACSPTQQQAGAMKEEPQNVSAPNVSTSPQNNRSSGPHNQSVYCFLCDMYSEAGETYHVRARPAASASNSPYFPFLLQHTPKSRSEPMQDDTSALVCTFCYHSLVSQWRHIESADSPPPPAARTYNLHDYVCYVCGVTTYRKRIRSLSCKDFPFLKDHRPPAGSLLLNSGIQAAVCLNCYDTLRSQWTEYERWGLPVEKRQYNWIALPPPPEQVGHTSNAVKREHPSSPPFNLSNPVKYEQEPPVKKLVVDTTAATCLSSTTKPPPLQAVPPTKLPRTTVTVAPLAQVPPANTVSMAPLTQGHPGGSTSTSPAVNAGRASSFAAALRNLAKQAGGPETKSDQDESTCDSTPPISRSMSPRTGPPPLLSSNTCNMNSSPVMTNTPTPAHSIHTESRKALDRPPPLTTSGTAAAPPLSSADSLKFTRADDPPYRSAELVGVRPEDVYRMGIHPDYASLMSRQEEMLRSSTAVSRPEEVLRSPVTSRTEDLVSRGFQPYRPEETRLPHLPLDPTHLSYPAPFPPSLYPLHLHPHAYRYEEQLYAERYGLMRPPMMALPPYHPMSPLMGVRYPPDMLASPLGVGLLSPGMMQDRLKLEEEQRAREIELVRERDRERERVIERERERQREKGEEKKREERKSTTEKHEGRKPERSLHKPLSSVDNPAVVSHIPFVSYPSSYGSTQAASSFRADLQRSDRVSSTQESQAVKTSERRLFVRPFEDSFKCNSTPEPIKRDFVAPSLDGVKQELPETNKSDFIQRTEPYKHKLMLSAEMSKRDSVSNPPAAQQQSVGSREGELVLTSEKHKHDMRAGFENTKHSAVLSCGASLGVSDTFSSANDRNNLLPVKTDVSLASNNHSAVTKCQQAGIAALPKVSENASSVKTSEDTVRSVIVRTDGIGWRTTDICSKKMEPESATLLSTQGPVINTSNQGESTLLVNKGLPAELDSSPMKLSFLGSFGLTTQENRNSVLLAECERRQSQNRLSPLPVDDSTDSSCHTPPLPCPREKSANLINAPDYPEKVTFLQNLNLEPISKQRRRERETAWQLIINDRVRRNCEPIPGVRAAPWLLQPEPVVNVPEIGKDVMRAGCKRRLLSSGFHRNKHPKHEYNHFLPLPTLTIPSAPTHNGQVKVSLFKNGPHVDGTLPPERLVSQEFAAEFHRAVLESTTQQQNSTQNSDWEESRETSSRWFGIENIILAYHRYQQDRKSETNHLKERHQQLQSQITERRNVANSVNQHMADVVATRRQMELDRQKLQDQLESLQRYLSVLR